MTAARRALVVLALAAPLVAGCAPTVEDGHFACEPGVAGNCPEGLACIDGRCRRAGARADGGPSRIDGGPGRTDGGPRTDAGERDGSASDAGVVCDPACEAPLECCDGRCADTATELANCGACGAVCTTSCSEGACDCREAADCEDGNPCTTEVCEGGDCTVGPPVSCGPCHVCNSLTGDCDRLATGTTCPTALADGAQPCEAAECDASGNCLPTGHCADDVMLRLDATPGANCEGTGCRPCGGLAEACCDEYPGVSRRACVGDESMCMTFGICIE